MAGCSRLEFLRRLADHGIAAMNLDEGEAQAERRGARDLEVERRGI